MTLTVHPLFLCQQRLLGAGSLVAHNHLPVVVIMPPEVTYHALCVLIKYMYSGEATVPNSQLGAVLRAGDILKVSLGETLR